MKMEFTSQRIELFLFFTTNMAAMTLQANYQYERVGISTVEQGAKKNVFKACHLGKLKLAYTSPANVISTSLKNILMSRIDFTVLL